RVLRLVPAGGDPGEQAPPGQGGVGPGEERLTHLGPGERARLGGGDSVALAGGGRDNDPARRPRPRDGRGGGPGAARGRGGREAGVSWRFVLCDFGARGRW